MPTGPKGEKRPRDPNQLAKLLADIAFGQVEDREPEYKAEPPAKNTLKAKSRGASPRIIAAIVDGTAPADLTVTGVAKALPDEPAREISAERR
jgi:hypothetical protein